MSTPHAADRNLLFGILALHMDLIGRDALIAAMHAWMLHKAKPLGQILHDQGQLPAEQLRLLDALVQTHIQAHHGDPQESLAALSAVTGVPQELTALPDADVQCSLVALPTPSAGDAGETIADARAAGARYRILRPHARGGLGQVSVAADLELNREVALKEIQPEHADDPASRARFLREAEITGGLEHPGVVPVHGLGRYADGRPFYAMRFIRGESFKEAIQRFYADDQPRRDPSERSLAFRGLLRRFLDVCNAVAYAHSRGVLHRDLKPANIMLGPFGETLLVDWGLAKVIGRPEDTATKEPILQSSSDDGVLTRIGAVVGTPSHMSPEQAAGQHQTLGPVSDVYSLGTILYVLLTGASPIPGTDPFDILPRVLRGDFSRPRQLRAAVPVSLEAICLKAMALKPEDRYPTAQTLAQDVEHWLADEPVSAYPEPWPQRLRRWGRRHRTVVTGAACLLVAALLTLALLVAQGKRSEWLLQKEQTQTETARAAAVANAQLAQQNEMRAREAVEKYFTLVSEDPDLKEKGQERLRQKLLAAARDYQEQFVKEHAEDPQLRWDLAWAHYRLGILTEEIADKREALRHYETARDLFREVVDARPASEAQQLALAASHNMVGRMEFELGRMKEAEKAFLQALAVYQPMANARPEEPERRRLLAVTLEKVANARADDGRLPEALPLFQEALRLRQELANSHPAVPDYQADLADSFYAEGRTLTLVNRLPEAEVAYLKALAIRQKLADEHPRDINSRLSAGKICNNLGLLYRNANRLGDAERMFERALAIRRQLADGHPDVSEYQCDLSMSYQNLAILYQLTHREELTEKAYRSALAISERLVRDNPAVVEYAALRCGIEGDLGWLLTDMGQPAKALEWYARSIATANGVLRLQANHDYARSCLCHAYYNRGLALAKLVRFLEASADLDRAVKLETGPDRHVYAIQRARCLVRGGKREEGFAEADRVTAISDASTVILYDAALGLADLSAAATDLAQANRYATRALALLRQVVAAGFKRVSDLRTDKDLEPLRRRPDFQKLLTELELTEKAHRR